MVHWHDFADAMLKRRQSRLKIVRPLIAQTTQAVHEQLELDGVIQFLHSDSESFDQFVQRLNRLELVLRIESGDGHRIERDGVQLARAVHEIEYAVDSRCLAPA